MLSKLKTVQNTLFPFAPFAQFSTKKIEIFINGTPYQVNNNLSIYQAAKQNDIEIPRFCYHQRLKVAGNCRMCLVEVEKSPKPVASCCSQVAPAMKINTNSEVARLARGAVMEFLLANHPLDCPICDQGGECDLQNNSYFYGYDASRYNEFKRAVQDKNVGPLIVTHMNRCSNFSLITQIIVHCTRCIRFAQEVAGCHDLGTTGRGRSTEINTYVEKMLYSEVSGNLADVCPVGALNHGPTAYNSRPYELLAKPSIDLQDSIGSNLEYQYNSISGTIMRVVPRVHEAINEEWLSDKSRQAFDGLKRQRVLAPMLRRGQDFVEYAWEDILRIVAQRLNTVEGSQVAAGIGQFESIENIQAFKDFLNSLNCFNYEFRKSNRLHLPNNFRNDYLFNSQIENIEDSDFVLLVGVNPRTEAPVLNSRIMRTNLKKKTKIYSIGTPSDLTYEYEHLGNTAQILNELLDGSHPLCEQIGNAKLPMLIVGRDAFTRADGQSIIRATKLIANKLGFVNSQTGWNGYNVLHRSQGEINALQLGIQFRPLPTEPKVIFLLGCDNYIQPSDIPKDSFVVYIGSHGDQGAQYADVILPAATYVERPGTYGNFMLKTFIIVNTEGRVQIAGSIVDLPGHTRQQWQIFRALSEECGVSLPYNSFVELRSRLQTIIPHIFKNDHIERSIYGKIANKEYGQTDLKISTDIPFVDLIDNYYMTDSVSRNSISMAKCSTAFNPVKFNNFKKIRQNY